MSAIEWTDETWNPIAGCSLMSPGCTNCYAMRMAARLEAMSVDKYSGLTRKSGDRSVWTGKVRFDDNALKIPLRWRLPRKVFVNSMSDLFHPDVSEKSIRKIWDVMALTPQHTYQILSKRPDRMLEIVTHLPLLPNVWLGTSVESNDYLHRIDELRKTPAVVRFVSFEPLLSSVKEANLSGIAWAIVGGESGPRSRPIEALWVNEVKRICKSYKVAFFFKQWGGPNKKKTGRMLDGRTWDEYPTNTTSAHAS